MTTSETPQTLKFYRATAVKRICFNSGFIDPGASLFLAKWNELYVIARDTENFFIVEETKAPDYIRSERDAEHNLVLAENPPAIPLTAEAFQWTVECGNTCPDGTDETISGSRTVATKQEAMTLASAWDGTQVRGNRGFIRIRGPAFYQIKRPTPRPQPQVGPIASVLPPQRAPVRRSVFISPYEEDRAPQIYSNDTNEFVRINPETRTSRVTEELVQLLRLYQNRQTQTNSAVSANEELTRLSEEARNSTSFGSFSDPVVPAVPAATSPATIAQTEARIAERIRGIENSFNCDTVRVRVSAPLRMPPRRRT